MRGRLVSFGVAAVVSRAVYGALRGRVAGGGVSPVAGGGVSPAAGESGSPVDRGSVSGGPWTRVNHGGRVVDLCAGPAVALGAAVGAGSGPVAFAVLAAGACGAYDDVKGDSRRGFRAHLTALRDGEVTSGTVKLFGIGAASLVAGALLKERAVDKVLAGVVIAGTAHLVNLVDVRPGRAGLAVLALGAPGLLRGASAAAPMGAVTAVLGDDLGERTMLGDTGAHALGAAVGCAIAVGNGRLGLAVHAAGLTAAAAWGERETASRAHPSG
ncbi:hypothetical protein [Streptomyces venezuelae]|uniref:UDP-N-acetylmuramyl pentapeptide phosphotransferase/UDP-N-acetylglucosamine-1-phosphate transferase n=2 Tax=Streptomyces venezuelae TaxID=54571 RepID=F2RFC4_STRVP|nr:hypothetical protein vnz_06940 [Streptomyces venezuelae]QER98163.1 hypothetical protein DEJ43_07000 [Streptomyces venezuelae ATCC 10712]CCA54704.1 hypothetical protein SVEN_1417 [Streptomyces venezuelae ATCC 10712]